MTTQSFSAAALVNEVCVALGKGFVVTKEQSIGSPGAKYGCMTFIIEAPELGIAKLFARVDEYSGRIETTVSWPMTKDHRQVGSSTYVRSEIAEAIGGYPKTIGVSYKRGPAAIAADLRKRLIPRIAAFEPLVSNGMVREIAQENFAWGIARDISATLGYSADHFEKRKANGANNNFPIDLSAKSGAINGSANFKIDETGSIGIKLTGLTKAQAKAVINALKLNG